jgi:hypothetical protein
MYRSSFGGAEPTASPLYICSKFLLQYINELVFTRPSPSPGDIDSLEHYL